MPKINPALYVSVTSWCNLVPTKAGR